MPAPYELPASGIHVAVVTLAEGGLCCATSQESGCIPLVDCSGANLAGAGTAVTAAIYGPVTVFPVDEDTRLTVRAETLALKFPDAVCPNLSLERLHDHLVA